VLPRTRLRLVRATNREQRFVLERGTIHAVIAAPPRVFLIDTAAALATDLGCVYSLTVDAAGNGELSVTEGWVQLDGRTRTALVPAGALSRLGADGPGPPIFMDASTELRSAVVSLSDAVNGQRSSQLHNVITYARQKDALTLLQLLPILTPGERGQLFDRLAELVAPPAQVTRELISAGDQHAIDLWWTRLDLPRFKKAPRLPFFGR
jgi:hypothetical protein